jgi:hypothetical protein
MSKPRVIGSYVKIALNDLQSAGRLGFDDRNAAQMIFQAAENLTMAALTSEEIDVRAIRRRVGNHQLGAMIAELPDACAVKEDLDAVSMLEAYAMTYRYPTAGGRIPEAPEPAEAKQWFDALKAIAAVFCTHFRITPTEQNPIARNLSPMRKA